MGRIGLSVGDFRRLTPPALSLIIEAYNAKEQQEWERTRLLATLMLQPYSKNKLTPEKVLNFPWDSKHGGANTQPHLSREEHIARAKELVELQNKS